MPFEIQLLCWTGTRMTNVYEVAQACDEVLHNRTGQDESRVWFVACSALSSALVTQQGVVWQACHQLQNKGLAGEEIVFRHKKHVDRGQRLGSDCACAFHEVWQIYGPYERIQR